MRVLVTRPEADAAPLVEVLEARGHEAEVQPLLVIEPVAPDPPLELAGVQALLFTSANGVRAFAAASNERGLPAFAVGDATAAAARAAGFAEVESAQGDVRDLARLVADRLDPADGALLHGAGGALAGDLQGDLEGAGFAVRRSVLYRAEPVRELAGPVRAALAEGRLDAALFFSPRTAKSFVRLVAEHDLAAACAGCRAVCLSRAVADALGALSWGEVRVAARPNQQALLEELDALDRDLGVPGPEASREEETMAEDAAAQAPEHDEGRAAGVIAAFGGIRPMAHKLGLAVSTVQGWKERDAIPANRHAQVLAAAEAHGVTLGDAERAALGGAAARPEPEAAPAAAAHQPLEVEILPPLGREEPEPEPEAGAQQGPAPEPGRPPRARGRRLAGLALAGALLALLALGLFVTRGLWYPAAEEDAEPAVTAAVPPPSNEPAPPTTPAPAETPAEAPPPAELSTPAEVPPTEPTTPAEAPPEPAGPPQAAQAPETVPPAEVPPEAEAAPPAAEAPPPVAAELQQPIVPPEPRPAAPPEAAPGGAPESLAAVLDGLSDRVQRLEEAAAAPAVSADQLAGLSAEQEALAGRLAAVEARLASLDGIEAKLEGLAREAGPPPTRREVALMIALAQLSDALGRGGPYGAELELLRGVVADDPELTALLAPLEAHAAAGAPTRAALERDFPEVARAVVADSAGGEEPGLVSGMLRRLSDVVTVRPVGEVEGADPGALVARAEHRLRGGDLAGALAELAPLDGPAAEAAAGWRAGAEARLAVEAALSALRARAVAGLVPAGG